MTIRRPRTSAEAALKTSLNNLIIDFRSAYRAELGDFIAEVSEECGEAFAMGALRSQLRADAVPVRVNAGTPATPETIGANIRAAYAAQLLKLLDPATPRRAEMALRVMRRHGTKAPA